MNQPNAVLTLVNSCGFIRLFLVNFVCCSYITINIHSIFKLKIEQTSIIFRLATKIIITMDNFAGNEFKMTGKMKLFSSLAK